MLLVLGVVGTAAAAPAYAEPSPAASGGAYRAPVAIAAAGDCTFPSKDVPAKPWALQRVFLDELWGTGEKVPHSGQGVKVAVIDTGVDDSNPQLKGKVIAGPDLLGDAQQKAGQQRPEGGSTTDKVGHGTKVAGIIAAAPRDTSGFVGLAKDATIISIRQNDSEGHGSVSTLIDAINKAVDMGAGVINISQDVRVEIDPSKPADSVPFAEEPDLRRALNRAEAAKVVVVASSGNDGAEGPTYPAFYDTVLAVGASDRNNERATFSQYGDFVDVVAPGVDMLSTVPAGGQCTDNGTSFSAPYVSGLAAVLKGMHGDWTPQQIRTVIEQTAQRTEHGRNKWIGWGVVDPVKAVTYATVPGPSEAPHPDAPTKLDTAPLVAQPLGLAETQADRDRKTGTFVLGVGALLVAGLAGGAIVTRDLGRRRNES
ncbi:type VII secretion-associated serine protease mycosin [Kitasatospora cheerisanensis]|uniref:Putative peptidase S08 family protein n=1 Tax=Kitasatospora cheerisanensis KCTC 2395 TaxID=1348663 RepID=A0A066YYE5_9ACTN|nr:type VII secretion-associated serine protease mycosin [Kitasatospora cheerisanensis]KDN82960.1 putative peptidase S08 family protein [Kitasatospora cheerisanensis KCTC 2395]